MSCSIDDVDELNEMVRDSLVGRRCLIVFDGVEYMTGDLWLHKKHYWFDFIDVGPKVLITTPSEGVANLKLLANELFELEPLSQYDGLSLCRILRLFPQILRRILQGIWLKILKLSAGIFPCG